MSVDEIVRRVIEIALPRLSDIVRVEALEKMENMERDLEDRIKKLERKLIPRGELEDQIDKTVQDCMAEIQFADEEDHYRALRGSIQKLNKRIKVLEDASL